MSTDHHAEGFRPSHFRALTACIHHRNKPGQSEAAERGTGVHELIANAFRPNPVRVLQREVIFAVGIVEEYQKQGWRIFAVEVLVDILDENGQKISHGTIDLVLERNGEYLIIDWKTGDKGDYDIQVASYKMAWWDMHPHASVKGLIAYVDLRETQEVVTDWSDASFDIITLWEKWNHKESEPYVINGFCDYCALRGECPAWRKEAALAFDAVNGFALHSQTGLPQGGDLVAAKIDGLKNDPVTLESFLTAWERAKILVEEDWSLKEALKTHMETGFKAANHILVNRKATKEVEKRIGSEAFLTECLRDMGFARAAQAITVNPDKALELWKGYTDEPFPVDIQEIVVEKPGYTYVRAKGKPGAGDARKKRKELE